MRCSAMGELHACIAILRPDPDGVTLSSQLLCFIPKRISLCHETMRLDACSIDTITFQCIYQVGPFASGWPLRYNARSGFDAPRVSVPALRLLAPV